MILVWGSEDDPPVTAVLDALRSRGVDTVHVDKRSLATVEFDLALAPAVEGSIKVNGRHIDVAKIAGIYLRPEPFRDMRLQPASSALLALTSLLDAVVINRPAAGRSNLSKPYQLIQIASAGLAVPETLLTTDPEAARTFLADHGRAIYKSISGIRSIVATIEEADAERLEGVTTGPVQFQEWVEGIDVRVHVVGRQCFATAIESNAADYRYGDGHGVAIVETSIDDELANRLVELAAGMGLLVAGIDLRLTPNDQWVCFEVNPSPGFTFYEEMTGQPIAAAVAGLLRGE